jgi:RNA polymerase sigma factor (TIGR02999 family)
VHIGGRIRHAGRPPRNVNPPDRERSMTQDPSGDTSIPMDRLLTAVYEEVRAVAASYLKRERPDHTLQPTALVHEAYLKLQRGASAPASRAHLMALAASAMRQILVDHARARDTQKRGGGWERVTVDSSAPIAAGGTDDVLAVHEALARLATIDARAARVVELRFFGGLSVEETAEVLRVSSITVMREWKTAKAWLYRELTTGS